MSIPTSDARGSELQSLVDDVYAKYAPLNEGAVATYIPELAQADPGAFGVCIATSEGQVFEAGDCDRPFTIQSISKPFTFGMALEELGADKVMRHVGVGPSGDAFNSIELQNHSNRPFNPMVNSGAITVTGLLHHLHGSRTFEHLFAIMAATLANMGRNPLTGQSAYTIAYVKHILSIMLTCGMYDYSGQWAYRVGVPAKSGVAGGVIAVVNRQLGIGTYSPRLDPFGNSRRGTEVCADMAARLGLHVFDCLNVGSSFLSAVL